VHAAAMYVKDTSGKKSSSNSNSAQYYGLKRDGTRTVLAVPCIPPANVRVCDSELCLFVLDWH
jgi:hypothetical protein